MECSNPITFDVNKIRFATSHIDFDQGRPFRMPGGISPASESLSAPDGTSFGRFWFLILIKLLGRISGEDTEIALAAQAVLFRLPLQIGVEREATTVTGVVILGLR
jgi:hypothetical protein